MDSIRTAEQENVLEEPLGQSNRSWDKSGQIKTKTKRIKQDSLSGTRGKISRIGTM